VLGITKVEELANCDVQSLTERFGKMGIRMKQAAMGIDFGEVEEREGVKSISRHGTFEEDKNDLEKITKCVDMLANGVHSNLMKRRFTFRTITVIVRLEDFTTYTRSKTVTIWTSDINVIKKTAL
jgi:DNA polymerase IV (archaeal DinB-like DNA polymerase)